MRKPLGGRRWLAVLPALVLALVFAASASAHARVSPGVVVAKQLEVFSLAVPTEEEGATTTTIELTVPSGFSIDSFVDAPGWQRSVAQTGTGENAVIQKVTWTGGSVPTGEDSFFQFLGQAGATGTTTFTVRQTYSDGKVVDWSGPESSDNPAPRIEAVSSLGGGGSSSTVAVVAIVIGGVALVVGGIALFMGRGGRELT